MPITTKKLPVSQSAKGEFVVPDPHGRSRDVFLGIESGTEFQTAALSYIGREVSAQEVVDKFLKYSESTVSISDLVRCFESYLRQLQAFKIGNILKIEHLEGCDFKLSCVARSPTKGRSRRLPG
jgi:hypothetical protein